MKVSDIADAHPSLRRMKAGALAAVVTRAVLVDRIAATYAAMSHTLHTLLRWKRARGLCVLGISCLNPAEIGRSGRVERGCKACKAKIAKGKASASRMYTTPYGKIRLDKLAKTHPHAKVYTPAKKRKAA
jgi:hypothetical protein